MAGSDGDARALWMMIASGHRRRRRLARRQCRWEVWGVAAADPRFRSRDRPTQDVAARARGRKLRHRAHQSAGDLFDGEEARNDCGLEAGPAR